MAIGVKVVIFS